MGGENSVFNNPFNRPIKDQGPNVAEAERRRRDLLDQVQSEKDITDADRQRFLNELTVNAEQFKKDISGNGTKIGIDQFFGDIQNRFSDLVAVQRKKREGAEKQRSILNSSPGVRQAQSVNVGGIAPAAIPGSILGS